MLNQDKINHHCHKSRLIDLDALQRLTTECQEETDILEIKCKNNHIKSEYHELADDSLRIIQEDLAIRLSRFNTESFTIETEIKNIDRVLRLRKSPILDD